MNIEIIGSINKIIKSNGGFFVVEILSKNQGRITAKGEFSLPPAIESNYKFRGNYYLSKYGRQFKIESMEIVPSASNINDLIKYKLWSDIVDGGNTISMRASVYEYAKEMLPSITDIQIDESIQELEHKEEIVINNENNIYLQSSFENERDLAALIGRKLKHKNNNVSHIFDKVMRNIKSKTLFDFTEKQMKAISIALREPVSIVTGLPGSGKTSIVDAISKIIKEIKPENKIILAGTTGKAANQLAMRTGLEAQTVHSLLNYSRLDNKFRYNEDNPLIGQGVLIVDEFSMCDVELALHIFKAIFDNYRIIIVGDSNQLPSIGPGNVLNDLIESGLVPVVDLKQIFRRKKNSAITNIAKQISEGKVPLFETNQDLFTYDIRRDYQAVDTVVDLIKNTFIDEDPLNYQIITPMNVTKTGVDNLNKIVQDIVNPKSSKTHELKGFRVNDKVMIKTNDSRKGIYNGDIGIVSNIESDHLYVKLNRKSESVRFTCKEIKDFITLAYVITIHKSQGSEYSKVIMVLTKTHERMLERKLLYTGITRAKDELHLVADPEAVKIAINNNAQRNTGLKEQLIAFCEGIDIEDEVQIKDLTTGEILSYIPVKPEDANLDENKISIDTPLGSALLGKKNDQTVELKINREMIKYKIVNVATGLRKSSNIEDGETKAS